LLLVDVDQDAAAHRLEHAGPVHFQRLKHDVAVRKNDRQAQRARVLQRIERPREQTVRERIVMR
jgi:hypothetical protein